MPFAGRLNQAVAQKTPERAFPAAHLRARWAAKLACVRGSRVQDSGLALGEGERYGQSSSRTIRLHHHRPAIGCAERGYVSATIERSHANGTTHAPLAPTVQRKIERQLQGRMMREALRRRRRRDPRRKLGMSAFWTARRNLAKVAVESLHCSARSNILHTKMLRDCGRAAARCGVQISARGRPRCRGQPNGQRLRA
jgi:hypothetical protein